MERTIGIFQEETGVVRAVEALEAQGFGSESVRIIAGNGDRAQRVVAETDMPVDRLRGEEAYAGGRPEPLEDRVPFGPIGMLGAAAYLTHPSGYSAPGSADGYVGPVIGAAALYDGDSNARHKIDALGLKESDTDYCLDRIEQGGLLVVVDSDRTGRPYAESALREGGASTIL
ncbi:hypothetical protein [Paenibacillus sp. GYB004]|jgi:hypothetical protein|uniref:hypothetical protein n=1 Tax=unclassified Paenibacillus TaxID=185978 RepID=UPI002F96DE5C